MEGLKPKGAWSRARKWPEHRIRGELVCERCGKTFPAKAYQIRRGQRFCSGECRYTNDETRFWKYVKRNQSNSCWEWCGSKVSDRYGNFTPYKKNPSLAHRYCWEYVFGEAPVDRVVMHRCDNPACVNPFHLQLGTQLDNARDRISKGRSNRRRLSFEKAEEIRGLFPSLSRLEIADRYGVNVKTIFDVLNRKAWIK